MSSVNQKRRAPSASRHLPVPVLERSEPVRPPSGLPSRPPVRWVEGEALEAEAWHADWDAEDGAVGDDGGDLVSDVPEIVDSLVPEEPSAEDTFDASDLDDLDDERASGDDDEVQFSPGEDDPDAERCSSGDMTAGDEHTALDKRRGRRRSKTIARKQMLRERRRMLAQGTAPEILDYERPIRRAECREGERPCLYVSCRYHLYLDVNPVTGSIKLNFPDKEVWELEETCALDVAERGGITLEEVGEIMNLTRERIRQVEVSGLEKLKQGDVKLHTFIDGRELELDGPCPGRLPIVED